MKLCFLPHQVNSLETTTLCTKPSPPSSFSPVSFDMLFTLVKSTFSSPSFYCTSKSLETLLLGEDRIPFTVSHRHSKSFFKLVNLYSSCHAFPYKSTLYQVTHSHPCSSNLEWSMKTRRAIVNNNKSRHQHLELPQLSQPQMTRHQHKSTHINSWNNVLRL